MPWKECHVWEVIHSTTNSGSRDHPPLERS